MRLAAAIGIVGVLALGSAFAAGKTHTDHPSYTVRIDAKSPSIATVNARVTLSQQTIKMLPWGHPWLEHGWATFVHDLEVQDTSGRSVTASLVEEEGWGSWTVDAEDGTVLELSYKVRFDHDQYDWDRAGGQDSRPTLANGSHFLVSRALFIYSPGVDAATVTLDVPEGWLVSTPWSLATGKTDTYLVDSWDSLVSNMIVLGEHERRVIEDGNMTIVLSVDTALAAWVDSFEEVFLKALESYGSLFGGTPNARYLVALRAANEDDGESFHDSFSQILTRDRLAQRKIIWSNTMAHELFHYWNGANFLVGKDKSRVEWFGEGFTEYYSSLTLLRTGLIDEAAYYKKLERYFARYFITRRMWPGEPLSLVEAGKHKHANWLMIYGGGATVALALDIEIRARTGNAKGLDDVMRLMKTRFGDSGRTYDIDDLIQCVDEVSGSDFTPFFTDYILGSEGYLDIPNYLEKAGLFAAQFTDEFYLSKIEGPTDLQQAIYAGITHQQHGGPEP